MLAGFSTTLVGLRPARVEPNGTLMIVQWARSLCLVVLAAATLEEPRARATRPVGEAVAAASVLETDAGAMTALEAKGLSLWQIFGATDRSNEALAKTEAWSTLLTSLEADIARLDARPGIVDAHPRKRFQRSWLRDKRARFELIGAVNRLDRSFLDRETCGESRLVYRLVFEAEGRPPTSLPMTVSVAFPQPKERTGIFGSGTCQAAARAWRDLPPAGPDRVAALAALFAKLPRFHKVEINLQSLHMPSQGAVFADGTGYDDHAEYLLRSFKRNGNALVAAPLVNTPRFALEGVDKIALAEWIRENFDAIDAGTWVLPDRFLAESALSVVPRGFARGPNRVFKSLFGNGAAFADLPYARGRLVKSPMGLLRRLDQGTCEGCHATRSVAGFHLLGESRLPEAHVDAVAVARSAHFDIEIDWRAAMTAAVADGAPFADPRPFAERKRPGPGRAGAHCAATNDPTFAGWTCMSGMLCHLSAREDIGACAAAGERGVDIGQPCQQVKLGEETPATGNFIEPQPMAPCVLGSQEARCDPNLFGFPGGMCIADCEVAGKPVRGDELHCGLFPTAGYENDCFTTADEPIEKCLPRYMRPRVLQTCGEYRACRDDYACARTVGLPPKTGLCVPTYFVYGLRVDGPLLDR